MFAFAKSIVKSAEGYINTAAETYEQQQATSDPTYGFRIIHVDQNSPASEAGLEALFDFVVGLNGHELQTESASFYPQYDQQQPDQEQSSTTPRSSMASHRHSMSSSQAQPDFATAPEQAPIDSFLEEIKNCKGRSISLDVWSSKGRITRTVMLPVDEALADDDDTTSVGAGMTLQWTPLSVADHVWHVLNVSPNSPAEQAGLISHADYIVGAENGLLEAGGESLLGRIVSRMVDADAEFESAAQPSQSHSNSAPELELYVYNHDYDTLRPVRIHPNNTWGGTGLLGCGVGYGLLHRLPVVAGKFDSMTSSPQGQRRSSFRRPVMDNSNNSPQRSSSSLLPPGGTLYEATIHGDEETGDQAGDTSSFITPAAMPQISVNSENNTNKNATPKKHKPHGFVPPTNKPLSNDMQDYFAEEEKRSKEMEGRTSTGASVDSSIPPPPKAK